MIGVTGSSGGDSGAGDGGSGMVGAGSGPDMASLYPSLGSRTLGRRVRDRDATGAKRLCSRSGRASHRAIDYLASIEADGERISAALAAGGARRIPWSDSWTVRACAHHLGSAHRGTAAIVAGRPTADFGVFADLDAPADDDPALGAWVAQGTAALLGELGGVDPSAPCWTWWPDATTVGFWHRRMALETAVHRWDLELGVGGDVAPIEPALASDGVDEFLDAFVGMARLVHDAPGGGETFHLHCTDVEGEWLIGFPTNGARTLTREHAKGDVAIRGPAMGLLLYVWGRLDADAAGVEIVGDDTLVERWDVLVPKM
jgi:uncharacterized protein (TIGR03083 family)